MVFGCMKTRSSLKSNKVHILVSMKRSVSRIGTCLETAYQCSIHQSKDFLLIFGGWHSNEPYDSFARNVGSFQMGHVGAQRNSACKCRRVPAGMGTFFRSVCVPGGALASAERGIPQSDRLPGAFLYTARQ